MFLTAAPTQDRAQEIFDNDDHMSKYSSVEEVPMLEYSGEEGIILWADYIE